MKSSPVFPSSCVMAEVCFGQDRNSLWTCFRTIGALRLHFSGAEALTISFFSRLSLLSETKILLLYQAVPDRIFRFICH